VSAVFLEVRLVLPFVTVAVHQRRQVAEPTVTERQIGNVADPQLIHSRGTFGCEQKIRTEAERVPSRRAIGDLKRGGRADRRVQGYACGSQTAGC
jgi:hypothetical protein